MSYLEMVSEGWSMVFSDRAKRRLRDDFHQVALPLLDRVYRAALYLTKDKSQAEDLVQETYLRAFRSFDSFKPGTNCKAWFLSILRNLFINQYNHKRRQPEMVDWETIEQTYEAMAQNGHKEPQSLFFSQLMDGEIQQALKELPEEFRTAIVLVDIEELSYEDAATVMNCPVGTIRSRVSRGRRMLQVALREYALEKGLIKGSPQEDSASFIRSQEASWEV